MRAYGYVRISRDEDGKKESIETQKKVIIDFAQQNGIELIDIFEDNNVSGYTFERDGLNKLKELIEDGQVGALVAKDLSRIGRHNAKVLLFLDYLDDKKVRLMLKSDNYDSESDDDTMLGIRAWYNEMYLKDLSKKITANIRQKQKEGLVIVQHYGYMKDPADKNKLIIDEDVADTVRLIFKMYLEGYGCNKISQYLNSHGYETPAVHKMKKFGFGWKPNWTQKDLWYATSVKRILRNDTYIGTLRCGTTKVSKMKGKKVRVDEQEQYVHPDFMPAIIDKEDFNMAQQIFEKRFNEKVRAGNQKIHKYAGILKCGSCHKGFVARKQKAKMAYVCSTFHKFGAQYCSSHRVMEEDLDEIILAELNKLLYMAELRLDEVDKNVAERLSKKRDYVKQAEKTRINIHKKEEEIKGYARQLAQGFISEKMFLELSGDANRELARLEEQLTELEKLAESNEYEKENIIKSIDVLRDIIQNKALTNTNITLLIDKINIKETDEIGEYNRPKLDIEIVWNAPFVNISESYYEVAV
jgi:DNA invertase Pin-like site-specific DNA recombinase